MAKSVFPSKSNCQNSGGWHFKRPYKNHPSQDLNSHIIRFDSNISTTSLRDRLAPERLIRNPLPAPASTLDVHCEMRSHTTQNTETHNNTFPWVINSYKDRLGFSQVSERSPFHVPDSSPPAVCERVPVCSLRSVFVCGRQTHTSVQCVWCPCLQDITP